MVLSIPRPSYADAALLLGEPYGKLGSVSPTGHASVYLVHICAESPTVLRRCQPGETGVVISRYNRVAGRDWLAIPVIPYLYAVERADDVPLLANRERVTALRNDYLRSNLEGLIPDASSDNPPKGDWIQLVGSAYDRTTVAFMVKTTPAQDDELIRVLNARQNRRRFNFFFRNCADFARDIMNLYFPNAISTSFIADVGLTTPKQVVKALARYSSQHPDAELTAFVIPQIPGNRRSSGKARGVMESLVKTKKYVIPLTIVQPWIPASLAAGYVVTGRFNPHHYATRTYQPEDVERYALVAARPD